MIIVFKDVYVNLPEEIAFFKAKGVIIVFKDVDTSDRIFEHDTSIFNAQQSCLPLYAICLNWNAQI